MNDFRVVMQAKKNLYFVTSNEDEPPMPFMLKNDLRLMQGVRTTRLGYHPIEHNDENFRFFVPVDMLKSVF